MSGHGFLISSSGTGAIFITHNTTTTTTAIIITSLDLVPTALVIY
jgi:hypothetical protein